MRDDRVGSTPSGRRQRRCPAASGDGRRRQRATTVVTHLLASRRHRPWCRRRAHRPDRRWRAWRHHSPAPAAVGRIERTAVVDERHRSPHLLAVDAGATGMRGADVVGPRWLSPPRCRDRPPGLGGCCGGDHVDGRCQRRGGANNPCGRQPNVQPPSAIAAPCGSSGSSANSGDPSSSPISAGGYGRSPTSTTPTLRAVAPSTSSASSDRSSNATLGAAATRFWRTTSKVSAACSTHGDGDEPTRPQSATTIASWSAAATCPKVLAAAAITIAAAVGRAGATTAAMPDSSRSRPTTPSRCARPATRWPIPARAGGPTRPDHPRSGRTRRAAPAAQRRSSRREDRRGGRAPCPHRRTHRDAIRHHRRHRGRPRLGEPFPRHPPCHLITSPPARRPSVRSPASGAGRSVVGALGGRPRVYTDAGIERSTSARPMPSAATRTCRRIDLDRGITIADGDAHRR